MARTKRNESPERQALYGYKNKYINNSRNGYSKKTMHTSYGDMDLDIHRDRNGEYEPQVIKKYQNTITRDMEEKIISMYAKGQHFRLWRKPAFGCQINLSVQL